MKYVLNLKMSLAIKEAGWSQDKSHFYWKICAGDNPNFQEPFVASGKDSGADYRVAAPTIEEFKKAFIPFKRR